MKEKGAQIYPGSSVCLALGLLRISSLIFGARDTSPGTPDLRRHQKLSNGDKSHFKEIFFKNQTQCKNICGFDEQNSKVLSNDRVDGIDFPFCLSISCGLARRYH